MGIVGATVYHKTLGRGKIIYKDLTSVCVKFDNEIIKFFSPFSFGKKLLDEFYKEQLELEKNTERKEVFERSKLHEAERARLEQEIIEQEKAEREEKLRQKKEKIRNIVNLRNIKEILHFTAVDNLESILKNGILSRCDIKGQVMKATVNDELRLDSYTSCICCSITLPNAPLLYKFKSGNIDKKYVILKIKPNVLWEKYCLFSKENAASNRTCPRCTVEAFEQMFGDYDKMHTRADLEKLYADGFIKQNMPTHNQAEVLVVGQIEPEYITGVYVFENDWSSEIKKVWEKYQNIEWKRCPENDFMRRCKNPEKAFWQNTKSVQM